MESRNSPPACRVAGLCVSFFARPALDRVTLDIPARGISVLVGRSGSGKTTFLRALNRLNEEFPGCQTAGSVEINFGGGLEAVYGPTARPLPEIRRRVGMVFQTPNVLPVSVRKNITMPLELAADCRGREAAERMREALDTVGLWSEVKDRLSAPAATLSVGQQQRLCLARALALRPAVLLLDEPTAALDVHAAEEVEILLARLAEHHPLVMVSHRLDQAVRLAVQCAVFSAGRVVHVFAEGTAFSQGDLADCMA